MHALERLSIENMTRKTSRRLLLKGSLAAGFMLSFRLPLRAADEMDYPPKGAEDFAPNAFIRIDHSGKTTLTMPQVEMGQGVYTAISQVLAEELDADFAKVALEHAPPDDALGNERHTRDRAGLPQTKGRPHP